jgi:hypothetical protein
MPPSAKRHTFYISINEKLQTILATQYWVLPMQSIKWPSDQFHLTHELETKVGTRVLTYYTYLVVILLLYRYFSINMIQKKNSATNNAFFF